MVATLRSEIYGKRQINNSNAIINTHFQENENLKDVAIFKFNRFVSFILISFIMTSMVSYSMVIAKENAIISVHNKINDINFENIDLQNKVDYARSFYNINSKVEKANFLKKPDKIWEVSNSGLIPKIKKNNNEIKIKPISGY